MGKKGRPASEASGDEAAGSDVAMVLDRTEDSDGYRVLRHRAAENRIELGTLRPLKEGRPIDGEVISLQQREDHAFLYDVKTELADPSPARRLTSDGPAQIATEEYRRGWDAIWGKPTAGNLN
ncbi:MAG TPA: hypothetical protein VGG33_22660 [Polyangia bacterium]